MAWELVTNIKGVKGDKGDVDPTQVTRFEMLESIIAEPGSRVENLVIDPVPYDAPSTYVGGRATITQDGAKGRATCNTVGATYVYPKASTGTGAEVYFPATAGTKIAARVVVTGHPTQEMGATLTFVSYVWDGSAFSSANTASGVSSVQLKIPAGADVTFEAMGTVPASNTTHVVPQLTFRRWAETYPQVGDYVGFSKWAVQAGADAAVVSPVPYTDGTVAGAYWTGVANRSASVALSPKSGAEAPLQRDALVALFKNRRGGVIGTDGKPAIALRFDHAMDNFWAKVHPLLVKYRMPWVQAAYTDMYSTSENSGSTFADLQQRAINTGGEVAYHSGNHLDAVTDAAIYREMVTKADEMRGYLPRLPIEQYIPPGVAAGPMPAGYKGFMGIENESKYYDTYAGRLAMQGFPVCTGYREGVYRPMPSGMAVALTHVLLEKATPSYADGVIRGLTASGANGLVFMLHPRYVDTTGYITSADLETIFANIAARRDNGELVVLSHSGLYVADPFTSYRNDLVANGTFKDSLNGWVQTGNTLVTENGITFARSGATGSSLVQTNLINREALVYGATRELVYKVRATAGAVVRAQVSDATNTSLMNATSDTTLPAAPGWVEVRQMVTIPTDFGVDNLSVTAGRVSGGSVDVTDIRLQAI